MYQVVELQGCMREVVRAVCGRPAPAAPAATQTDITAVLTPQVRVAATTCRSVTATTKAIICYLTRQVFNLQDYILE